MKQLVRGFSIGIFITTIIIGVIYFLDKPANSHAIDDLTEEEAIQFLKEKGYYTYTEDLETKLAESEEKLALLAIENSSNSNNVTGEEEPSTENEEITYSLVIEPGMTVHDISELLLTQQIISNEEDFLNFFTQEELTTLIQIGTFELTNQMSILEIAQIITRTEIEA
jgi:hypothetical protein